MKYAIGNIEISKLLERYRTLRAATKTRIKLDYKEFNQISEMRILENVSDFWSHVRDGNLLYRGLRAIIEVSATYFHGVRSIL